VDRADLHLLWGYSTWANGQILAAAGRLPPTALRKPLASGHGTLFGTLLHILDTEYGWRMLVEQGAETPVLTEHEIPDLAALAERFAAEAAAMRAYLAGLTDKGLAEPLRYEVGGQQRERVRWHVLFHVVNHSARPAAPRRGRATVGRTAGLRLGKLFGAGGGRAVCRAAGGRRGHRGWPLVARRRGAVSSAGARRELRAGPGGRRPITGTMCLS
jgi:uncharacterized damage-inducible protein DinB